MSDEVFDQVTALLPAESPIGRAPGNAASPAPPTPVSAPQSPPVNAMANLGLHNNPPAHQRQQTPSQNPTPAPSAPSPAPPAYNQTGPPSLPVRGGPPAAPPPSKPVLAHARALYRYQAADERDLSFERDDRIAVHEYMNDDWWMGRNERTGAEGIFPKNYVHIDQDYKFHNPQQQKHQPYGMPPPQHQPPYGAAGYPAPPPGAQNPYNSHVPPMAVAQGGGGHEAPAPAQQEGGSEGGNSKINEHGKKFGKKLGNAAIFGAGATMGSNLVNSIF